MPVERSAGAIIFRKEEGKTYYLLLNYPSGTKAKKEYWDFPKGHIEKGENETDAAKREAAEETGLADLKFVEGFKEMNKYFFKLEGETVFKTVAYYLTETKKKEIKLSLEHIGFEWLQFPETLDQLSFKNTKDILTKANEFLKNYD